MLEAVKFCFCFESSVVSAHDEVSHSDASLRHRDILDFFSHNFSEWKIIFIMIRQILGKVTKLFLIDSPPCLCGNWGNDAFHA